MIGPREPPADGAVSFDERLRRIESLLQQLVMERDERAHYSTAEVAKRIGKAEFTFREWCRLGRILANKRSCGRGSSLEWMISREELDRIQAEGLLPVPRRS